MIVANVMRGLVKCRLESVSDYHEKVVGFSWVVKVEADAVA